MQTWVHKGTINHRARTQEQLDIYLQDGYELGQYVDPEVKDRANRSASEKVKQQHAQRSEDEKRAIAEKIRTTIVSKTEEEKQAITSRRLETRANWSDEQREKNSLAISKGITGEVKERKLTSFRNTLENRSVEDTEKWKENIRNSINQYYSTLSEEDRKVISERTKLQMASMSDEEKQARNEKIGNTLRNTFLSKYGVPNPMQLDYYQEKMRQTILERYGVPYYCMTSDCRGASNNDSSCNNQFAKLLEEKSISYEREFHIDTFSYDFKVGNFLIEINPTPYHNSTWSPFNNPKDKSYHSKKTKVALGHGFRCIHVWDWDDKNKIISLLLHRETVYARSCVIREVSKKDCIEYLNRYHLQGWAKSKINLGLYYNDELVSLMTFDKPRYNKNYEYELIRFCSHKYIVGGAEKLFKHFVTMYNPQSIISYCDNSKFLGDVYTKLGFLCVDHGIPTRHWYGINSGKHITDNLLRQRGFDQLFGTEYGKGTSNEQLMIEHGFVEIYDCGQSCYIWKKN